MKYLLWLKETDLSQINHVGGKNASLGEMIQNLSKKSISVPNGFVVTTDVYDKFLEFNNLNRIIPELIHKIEPNNLVSLKRIGTEIRTRIQNGVFPDEIKQEINKYYRELSQQYTDAYGEPQEYTDVAVRSSGTAEDLPDASFAGQQETFLNVRGFIKLCESIKSCIASLYTDRAISYRHTKNVDSTKVKISVCVQKMVRSDLGSAGVAFSLDTESGFNKVILINGSYGLGELIVGGAVKPDEFIVFKDTMAIIDKKMGYKETKMVYGNNPSENIREVKVDNKHQSKFCLDNSQIIELATWVKEIEDYYSKINNRYCPMDIEWAYDGLMKKMFIVQARPETVHSKKLGNNIIEEYSINFPENYKKDAIITGVSVGNKVGRGKVKILYSLDDRTDGLTFHDFNEGDILVTEMTDPDWEPVMKKASAIVTNKGGRTCHASIVARELGIPAIVGTINAVNVLNNDDEVTVSCCEGETGYVYKGLLQINKTRIDMSELNNKPTTPKVMMNLAAPDRAFSYANYPNQGVGLAREEFIINNFIQVHPQALMMHQDLDDKELTKTINNLIKGFPNEREYYIQKLSYGIARIAAASYPEDVIVRFSDFKSNEYYNLLGGNHFEPDEENPMIGWRGASRYYSKEFKESFGMECEAIRRVRNEMGLINVIVMIPFCRTVEECKLVLGTMEEYGLKRKENGLQVYLMCEIPSNVILADEFSKYVDGYSIGSNDLTQLTLGVDRDSALVAHVYNERNEAVKMMISKAIKECHKSNIKVGICGQGPSDFPDFADFLIKEGIDSISVTPDTIYSMKQKILNLTK